MVATAAGIPLIGGCCLANVVVKVAVVLVKGNDDDDADLGVFNDDGDILFLPAPPFNRLAIRLAAAWFMLVETSSVVIDSVAAATRAAGDAAGAGVVPGCFFVGFVFVA